MRRTFLRALLTLAASSCVAASAADARHTDELMHKSGLWAQVAEIGPTLKAGAAQARVEAGPHDVLHGMGDQEFARFTGALTEAFAADKMRAVVADELGKSLSADDERATLQWLSSDLGRRFTRIEEEGSRAEAVQEFQRESPAFLAALPKERLALCREIVKATRAGEAGATQMIGMMAAIAYGAASATAAEEKDLLPSLRRKFEANRPQIERFLAQQAAGRYAYLYRDVSDADLKAYVGFMQTPAGMRYNEAAIRALDRALIGASLEWGQRLAAMTPESRERHS